MAVAIPQQQDRGTDFSKLDDCSNDYANTE